MHSNNSRCVAGAGLQRVIVRQRILTNFFIFILYFKMSGRERLIFHRTIFGARVTKTNALSLSLVSHSANKSGSPREEHQASHDHHHQQTLLPLLLGDWLSPFILHSAASWQRLLDQWMVVWCGSLYSCKPGC